MRKMEDSGGYDLLFKVILLGDTNSKKTDLLQTFIGKDEEVSTSLDFYIKDLDYRGKKVRIQLWDTSGLERFRSVTAQYYRGSHGVLLTFNSTDTATFDSLDSWLSEVREMAPKEAVILITGCLPSNQQDEFREVSREKAEAFAQREKLSYVECDPLDVEAVSRIFTNLIAQVYRRLGEDTLVKDSRFTVRRKDADYRQTSQSKKCC